jgi:hypothetical protein
MELAQLQKTVFLLNKIMCCSLEKGRHDNYRMSFARSIQHRGVLNLKSDGVINTILISIWCMPGENGGLSPPLTTIVPIQAGLYVRLARISLKSRIATL